MATELATAYVQIIPSAKGIKSNLISELSGASATAGETAGATIASKIKSAILTAGIGTALVSVIKSAVSEGAELEQAIGGIETLFEDASDTMMEYAQQAYETAGLSANDYMEQATSFAASLLQSLDGDTEAAADAANQAIIDMSDNANKLGTDIESIQNAYQGFAKQNYTMLDNLKLGYGGTETEMERLLEDAEELSGVEYDIDNLADVYAAIHVIQEDLGITGTTAEEAASTVTGSLASMKSALSNLLGYMAIGSDDIAGYASALISSTETFLFGNLIPMIWNVVKSLPEAGLAMIEELVDGFVSGIPEFLDQLPELITQFIESFNSEGSSLFDMGVDIILTLVEGLLSAIPELIAALPSILAALANGLFSKSSGSVTSLIKSAYNLAIEIVEALVTTFVEILKAEWNNTTMVFNSLLGKLQTAAASAFDSIKSSIVTKINSIKSTVTTAFNSIKTAMVSPIETAKKSIKNIVDTVKGFFNFTFTWPKIKLPHFSISPSDWEIGDLLKGSIPTLGISWYASGGIFDSPTIAGIGEAGAEAVVPLDTFWAQLTALADSIVSGIATATAAAAGTGTGTIQMDVYLYKNGPQMGEYIVDAYDTYKKRLG